MRHMISNSTDKNYYLNFFIFFIFVHPLAHCALISRFVAGKQESSNFQYIGFEMKQTNKEATLDQGKYVNAIEGIRIDPGRAKEKNCSLTTVEQTQLRSLVGQCNWVAQGTRPDLAYEVVELSSRFNSKLNVR